MLKRRLGLLQAVSLNMSMMVGIGPFITIPTLVGTLGGPQAMIGWILGALVAVSDGMVWSELAATFPGSGGTYHFFDAAYGESKVGRLLKFLFVWQFVFSGPLEVATGAIGLTQYLGFFFPVLAQPAWNWGWLVPGVDLAVAWGQVAAMGVMALVTLLAYQRIDAAGRLMVVFWVGMLITVAWVILTGLTHFDAARAFDFPEGAWRVDRPWMMGLGAALAIAMYDFLGYYQVCYLGDEVADAPRTIPRSILISTVAVSVVYLVMNVGILGVLPWREVVESKHVASDLMQSVHGVSAARVATVLIIWTALASTYAAMLGYSRIPYASARAGHFFRFFAKTHPRGEFPHRSLLLVSGMATLACLADLPTVIAALLTSRILVQFAGQIVTIDYLRARPGGWRPTFRMPLYPLPAVIALAGWFFVFETSDWLVKMYGVGSLAVGALAFWLWDASVRRTPVEPRPAMIGRPPSARGLTGRPAEIAEHAKHVACEWEDVAESFVQERLRQLGIPDHQIGAPDYRREGERHAFLANETIGGSNGTGRRLFIDSGVLNPRLNAEVFGPEASEVWAKSRLRDRIDAVTAHEYLEAQGLSHDAVLQRAPDTELAINENARRILRSIAEGAKRRR